MEGTPLFLAVFVPNTGLPRLNIARIDSDGVAITSLVFVQPSYHLIRAAVNAILACELRRMPLILKRRE